MDSKTTMRLLRKPPGVRSSKLPEPSCGFRQTDLEVTLRVSKCSRGGGAPKGTEVEMAYSLQVRNPKSASSKRLLLICREVLSVCLQLQGLNIWGRATSAFAPQQNRPETDMFRCWSLEPKANDRPSPAHELLAGADAGAEADDVCLAKPKIISSGDIPNSMWLSFSHHLTWSPRRTSWKSGGTLVEPLVEPWWNRRGTLPQVISPTACGTLVEPWWNPGGTLVEPFSCWEKEQITPRILAERPGTPVLLRMPPCKEKLRVTAQSRPHRGPTAQFAARSGPDGAIGARSGPDGAIGARSGPDGAIGPRSSRCATPATHTIAQRR